MEVRHEVALVDVVAEKRGAHGGGEDQPVLLPDDGPEPLLGLLYAVATQSFDFSSRLLFKTTSTASSTERSLMRLSNALSSSTA